MFCYECHEELLHNPVLLPADVERFAKLVRKRGLSESVKDGGRTRIAGRVALLHEVIQRGIGAIAADEEERECD